MHGFSTLGTLGSAALDKASRPYDELPKGLLEVVRDTNGAEYDRGYKAGIADAIELMGAKKCR